MAGTAIITPFISLLIAGCSVLEREPLRASLSVHRWISRPGTWEVPSEACLNVNGLECASRAFVRPLSTGPRVVPVRPFAGVEAQVVLMPENTLTNLLEDEASKLQRQVCFRICSRLLQGEGKMKKVQNCTRELSLEVTWILLSVQFSRSVVSNSL